MPAPHSPTIIASCRPTPRPPPAPTPLRIAVLGVGGIGSTFAFQLARVGQHGVTAVARPGSLRLDQLRRDSGIVNTAGERADVLVTDSLDEAIPYDLVLVTLAAHQVAAVLPALGRSAARSVQFMANTFEPDLLRDAVGAPRCSLGMPFVQGNITPEGRLNAKIGAGGQKSRVADERWATLFNAAGLPTLHDPKMALWLRCHVPLCIAFESISVAAVRRGGGATWGEAFPIARGMQEALSLVERLGYPLYPSGKAWLHAAPVWVPASMLWFLARIPSFRNLLATGANEARALTDTLIRYAPHAMPAVSIPTIRAMKPTELSPPGNRP